MIQTLLGGIGPRQFLFEYWHKKPLLIRQAVPGFAGLISPDEAKELVCEPEVESRFVRRGRRGDWEMRQGPLEPREIPKSAKAGAWTLLIQGLNLIRDDADELLRRFDFLPFARLDDLMVSYATDGGGVGPHFDSYDVFLLQGLGRRRWRISAQEDLELIEDAPLKILKRFQPTDEWVLEPGDMLYLPPRYAHDGIAEGECMTYSIGFRAPSAKELTQEFLYFLQDNLDPAGMYADPDAAFSRQPGRLPEPMVDRVCKMLESIRWTRQDVARFLGEYLSEPKPQVLFDPPERASGLDRFRKTAQARGLRLDRRSQLLYRGRLFHMNGESLEATENADVLRRLADRRRLSPGLMLHDSTWVLLHQWFSDGFIAFDGG